MNIYAKMYFRLFNRVTTALEALKRKRYEEAMLILKNAQTETEEMFISAMILDWLSPMC